MVLADSVLTRQHELECPLLLCSAEGHLHLYSPVKGVGEGQALCSAGSAQDGADAAGMRPCGGFTLHVRRDACSMQEGVMLGGEGAAACTRACNWCSWVGDGVRVCVCGGGGLWVKNVADEADAAVTSCWGRM